MKRMTALAAVVMVGTGMAGAQVGSARAAELTVSQINETRDLTSIDPFRSLDFIVPGSLIFDRLMERDASGALVPALATKWEQVEPTLWRFTIRSGVRFHDGSPLTAADAAATISYILNPANRSGIAVQIPPISGAEAPDATTLLVRTATPTGLAPSIVAALPVLPAAQVTAADAPFRTAPIGSGPYRLESWKSGDRVVAVANPAYWGEKAGWDRVTVKAVPEASTRVADLLSGGSQIAGDVPPQLAARVKAGRDVRLISEAGIRTGYMSFVFKPPFDDAKVRRAVYHGIDRKGLVEAIYGAGNAAPATGAVPERFGGYVAAFPLSDYDPAKARALLKEAGATLPLHVVLDATPAETVAAQIIQAQLAEAGFEVEINPVESTGALLDPKRIAPLAAGRMWMLTALDNHIFDTIRPFTALYADKSFLAQGPFGFKPDPRLQPAIDAYAAATGEAPRKAGAEAVMKIASESMPVVYLNYPNLFYGVADSVEFKPHGLGYLDYASVHPR